MNILKTFHILVFALIAIFLSNCSNHKIPPEKGETAYSKKAREKMEKALNLRDSGNPTQAIKVFSEIRSKFPFSKYSIRADFEIAETYFENNDFEEAIEFYDLFTRLYPGNFRIEQCYYKIAKSNEELIPGNFIGLLPPVYVRNLEPVENTLNSFYKYSLKFPKGKHQTEAQEKIKIYEEQLFKHEIYGFNWYFDNEKYSGAGFRLLTILKKLSPDRRKPYLRYWEKLYPKLGNGWSDTHISNEIKFLLANVKGE